MEMRVRAWAALWLPIAVGVAAVLAAGVAGTAPSREEGSREGPILIAAANTFKKSFRMGEPVPLAIAIANAGTEPAYVTAFGRGWGVFCPELRDEKGERVMTMSIPTPPEPPPDHFVKRNGKWVGMSPLWKLEGGDGVVVVFPDALEFYHKHLPKGAYTIHPAVDASSYRKESIVRREGLAYEYWAEAAALVSQHTLEANVIEITIE